MPDVITSTGQTFLSAEMQTFYDKVFLERLQMELTYDVLCDKKTVPMNSGKVVYFTRQTPFAAATTALTEGVNPDATAFSADTVSATLAEYGRLAKVSTLFSMTSIDAGMEEKVSTMGQNAAETIDTLIRDEAFTGATVQIAGGKAHISALAASDGLSVVEIRKAVKTLYNNKAPKHEKGLYKLVASSQGAYDLQGDTNQGNFVTANQYNTPDDIKRGIIGTIGGAKVYPTNNNKTESSTTTVYSNFIAGKGAIAMVDVAGQGSSVKYKKPGPNDTSNGLDMFATLGWKIPAFAVKTLNSSWLINIKTGS